MGSDLLNSHCNVVSVSKLLITIFNAEEGKLFAKGVVAVSRSLVSSLSELVFLPLLTIGLNVEIFVSERGTVLKSLIGFEVHFVME